MTAIYVATVVFLVPFLWLAYALGRRAGRVEIVRAVLTEPERRRVDAKQAARRIAQEGVTSRAAGPRVVHVGLRPPVPAPPWQTAPTPQPAPATGETP